MIPKAKILVATLVNRTMVNDIVDIDFQGFRNNFDLSIDEQEIKPGRQIELSISGRPGAYVGLAAYDKALLLFNKNHDLFWEDIRQVFDGFHSYDTNEFDLFHSMGLFARMDNIMFDESNDKSARSGQKADGTVFRKQFLESWLWKTGIIGNSGTLKMIEVVPDTTTSWYLTGFSIDPVYGLGIIKKPVELTTVQPFVIMESLPYSIKRGEAIEIQFILISNLQEEHTVDVTLYNENNEMEFIGGSISNVSYTKSVSVPPKVGKPVSFLVKAKKLGEMMVRVKASIAFGFATDALEKVIRVMPESLFTHHDGTPATGIAGKVEVSDVGLEMTTTSDNDGLIQLELQPNEDIESMHVSFVNKNGGFIFEHNVYRDEFVTNAYIKIELKSTIKLNKVMRFTVTSTERMTFFVYYVVSKGNIVDAGFMRPNRQKKYSLQLDATEKMIPKAKILVTTLVNRTMVNDIVDIDFQGFPFGFATDALEKVIRVMPESLVQTGVESFGFFMDTYQNRTFLVNPNFDKKADNGSIAIELRVNPNLLIKVKENLNDLRTVTPTCKNVIRLALNFAVADYLIACGPKAQTLPENAVNVLSKEYMLLMTCFNSDGSFDSVQNTVSMIFHTAFVANTLDTAPKNVRQTSNVKLEKAFDWLASRQQRFGSFKEAESDPHYKRSEIALTSYVLAAMLENESAKVKHAVVIEMGMRFLSKQLDLITSANDLAIATYAMMLCGHSLKNAAFEKLIDMSTITNNGAERC
uniref:Alpha-2-macroglobulin domain-containing protein n=1 Tax=Anopheles quadriannulatus TaxID=34691 RepID=A0A182X471_ANOQN